MSPWGSTSAFRSRDKALSIVGAHFKGQTVKKQETMKDVLARLKKLAVEKPKGGAWKGEKEGDCVAGEVKVMERIKSQLKKGKFQVRLVLDDGEQKYVVYANDPMERDLKDAGVKVGDVIGIAYKGTVKTKFKNDARIYSVVKA